MRIIWIFSYLILHCVPLGGFEKVQEKAFPLYSKLYRLHSITTVWHKDSFSDHVSPFCFGPRYLKLGKGKDKWRWLHAPQSKPQTAQAAALSRSSDDRWSVFSLMCFSYLLQMKAVKHEDTHRKQTGSRERFKQALTPKGQRAALSFSSPAKIKLFTYKK